jgi:membrane-bound lytic murein transglycosylase D
MTLSKSFNLLIILILAVSLGFAQNTSEIKSKQSKVNVYPDEYSKLDDNPFSTIVTEKNVKKIIEDCNSNIQKSTKYLVNRDTLKAKKLLYETEKLISALASSPNIANNNDYKALVNTFNGYFAAHKIDLGGDTPTASVRVHFEENIVDNKSSVASNTLSPEIPKVTSATSLLAFPEEEREYVQKSIDYLTLTKGRKFFTKWLERSGKWFPLFKRIAEEEQMPKEIIYLSMIESGLNPVNISKASAVGLWQFMWETGEDYGLNKDYSYFVDERRDPEKATRAAMKFLKSLYNTFGDWHLALAAYNCGAGRVQRTIDKSRLSNPSYWQIRKILPKETSHYVAQYLAAAIITMNPQAYGFKIDTIKYEPEYKYDIFTINEPIHIKALNECAGSPNYDIIKELNPELTKSITPPDKTSYNLKIPFGTKQSFITKFSGLTINEKQPWVTHSIRKKETLADLISKYKISKEEIIGLNDVKFDKKGKLPAGTAIRLPLDLATYTAYNEAKAIENREEEEKNFTQSDVLHTVIKGETMFSIARRYGLTLEEIRSLNSLSKDDESVYVGQKLAVAKKLDVEPKVEEKLIAVKEVEKTKLTEKSTTQKETVKAVKENKKTVAKEKQDIAEVETKTLKHKVKSGETLSKIADDYGVTVSDLKEENNLSKGKVKVGQVLRVIVPQNFAKAKANKNSKEKLFASKSVIHKVEKGENLTRIAAEYGVREDDIAELNPTLVKDGQIFSGTRLKIPNNESKGSYSAPKNVVNELPKYYKVRRGETIATIASKFGISVKQILKNNKNLSAKNLKAGSQIRLQ